MHDILCVLLTCKNKHIVNRQTSSTEILWCTDLRPAFTPAAVVCEHTVLDVVKWYYYYCYYYSVHDIIIVRWMLQVTAECVIGSYCFNTFAIQTLSGNIVRLLLCYLNAMDIRGIMLFLYSNDSKHFTHETFAHSYVHSHTYTSVYHQYYLSVQSAPFSTWRPQEPAIKSPTFW